jgi:hypothetical protein
VTDFIRLTEFKTRELIQILAKRSSQGFKLTSIKSDSEERWEITGDTTLYLNADRVKQITQEKQNRAKVAQKVKILDKVLCLIDKLKKEADIPKINEEMQKYQAIIDKEALLI